MNHYHDENRNMWCLYFAVVPVHRKLNFTRINGMEWCKLLCRPRRLAKPLLNGLRFKTSLFLQDYAETASPAGYRLFADQVVDV